jgi:DNA primase
VLFDGDSAGESASKRALPLLLAEGLLPQAIELPSGKDPDDLIREIGQAGFEQKLKESKDLYSVILNAAIGGRVLTHSEKVTVLDEMKVYFVEGIDPTLARLYASETAQKLGLDGRTVSDAFLKSLKLAPIQANVAPVRPNRPKTQGKKDADKIEVTLAALAFLENTFLQKLTEMGIEEHFLSEDLTLILKKAQELSGQNLGSSDSLLALMSAEIQSIGLLEHLMAIKAGKYGSDLNRLFEDCARRLRERILKGKSLAIINEMGVGTDPEKLERLRSIQEDRLKLMKSAERVGEEKE